MPEPFPEAVTGRSTKINVPLFNTIKRPPKKLPPPPTTLTPPLLSPLLGYLLLLQEVMLSLSLSLVQPVKVKGWHFLSKGTICSGENETCMVSRARPAVGQGRGDSRLIIRTIYHEDIH